MSELTRNLNMYVLSQVKCHNSYLVIVAKIPKFSEAPLRALLSRRCFLCIDHNTPHARQRRRCTTHYDASVRWFTTCVCLILLD